MERTKIVTAATAEEKERLKRILKKGLKSNLTDFTISVFEKPVKRILKTHWQACDLLVKYPYGKQKYY